MNINYNQFHLDNQIRVIHIPRNDNNITSISVFCNVGSINESGETEGMSHFLEHMLFKGTPKRPGPTYISKELDSVGAYFNAYTDKDLTCYIVKINSDFFDKGIDILSDMLKNSHFKQGEFDMEKNVVVEEVNRGKDNPSNKVFENAYEIIFKGHPLAHSIGSDEKNIRAYNREKVIKFFEHNYASNNIVISITSNKSFDEIQEVILNSEFKNYKINNKLTKQHHQLPIQRLPRYNIKQDDSEQLHLVLGFPVCSKYHSDRFVLDIINIILAGNMSSRLFVELREKRGLSYTVSIDASYYDTCGGFLIHTGFDKNSLFIKNQEKLLLDDTIDIDIKWLQDNNFIPGGLPIILETLKELTKVCVNTDELDKAIGFIKGSFVIETESSNSLSDYFGKQVISNYKPIYDFEKLVSEYMKIGPDDILRVAQKYFDFNKINIATIGGYSEEQISQFINLYIFNKQK